MSDIRSVAGDTKRAEHSMSIEAVHEAKGWLEWLTQREHRGRHDTWSAARDRAAKKAGVPETYAKRLWNRWDTMKDVSGGAYRALSAAYHDQCERQAATAAHFRQLREDRTHGGPTDQNGLGRDQGVASVPPRPSPPSRNP